MAAQDTEIIHRWSCGELGGGGGGGGEEEEERLREQVCTVMLYISYTSLDRLETVLSDIHIIYYRPDGSVL